jgi:hypothetical protein
MLTTGTLYLQKLALTSPTSGCSSVGIVRSRTQATEFVFFCAESVGMYPEMDSNHVLQNQHFLLKGKF